MEIIQKIMLFINQNTLLLIGICVFLILVLIGYLIDNSVKSKRVRKDIKNPDQVPENIKDEIIKQAEEKNIIKEEPKVEMNNIQDTPVQENNNIDSQSININEPTTVIEPSNDNNLIGDNVNNVNLDNNNNINLDNNNNNNNSDINASLDLDMTNSQINNNLEIPTQKDNIDLLNPNSIDMNNQNTPILNDISQDPDAYLMNQSNTVQYENDKSLSEILSNINNYSKSTDDLNIFTKNNENNSINMDIPIVSNDNTQNISMPTIEEKNENPLQDDNNIFSKTSSNIVINSNVNKNDVQIENSNSSDELDRIMRKLSSTNSSEDDNYTNIF